MGFEQKVLTDVTNARAAAVAAGAQGPAQQAAAENALTGTLRSLFAVVENYPDLKANENVLSLAGAADHDGEPDRFSRQHYNATVLDYNTEHPDVPRRLLRRHDRIHEARVLRRRARGPAGAGRSASRTAGSFARRSAGASPSASVSGAR